MHGAGDCIPTNYDFLYKVPFLFSIEYIYMR